MTATAQQLDLADYRDLEKSESKEMKQARAYKADSDAAGGLMTQAQARAILNITASTMTTKMNDGVLDSYEHFGKRLVGCDQLIEYARLEKIPGGIGAALLRAFKAEWTDRKKR